MEYHHRYYLEKWLRDHPRVEQVRICGTIAAMEVRQTLNSYFNAIGPILRAIPGRVSLAPLGNTIYLMPHCITSSELEAIYQAIRRVLDTL